MTPDSRTLLCPSCLRPTMRQHLEREPPETAIGVAFQPPQPLTLTWRCTDRACRYEPDGSFDPDDPQWQPRRA